ncbi:hypothetical protein OOT46_02625 [Aquabacterium sp. A7-Y]|uniref:hypothetical protein n=1 Tax=Aquabacterium sp. A7-Y TaxID=1349605 RepID=UPI00223E28A8|nr:hypothetical protein [Aquabacterium sp. A7-Y]MCW7536747.1 hypothetical protein [Aquabacterium sp. A7-Y]
MSELSMQCLAIAVSSVLNERERLLSRIQEISEDAEEEERLSERVMDIDRVLGELEEAYEDRRAEEPLYPSFEALYTAIFPT